jgi:iron complex outermembrane receptor protein
VFKDLEVSGSIYNLFDADYAITGADEHRQRQLRQDGRSFRLKLTYHF